MKVLVTGATGFVGRAVVKELLSVGHELRLAVRGNVPAGIPFSVRCVSIGNIDGNTNWEKVLDGVDAVVHLAGRAHVIKEKESDPEASFREVNFYGTRRLAEACVGKVRRLIFISTIGVHGDNSGRDSLYEESEFLPHSAYARSKAMAEAYLHHIANRSELDCCILRPPLVYGPNAPGNLAQLQRYIRMGVPLPLGSVFNHRNLIGVEHLARAIRVVLESEKRKKIAYVLADREAVSTPDIVRALGSGMEKRPLLLPMPVPILRMFGIFLGRRRMVNQLVGNLRIDASAFRCEFGDLQPSPTLDGLTSATRKSRN